MIMINPGGEHVSQDGSAGGRVSVVIPTRGRPVDLVRAVRSVLAQTCPVREVIAVIDGHDPETVSVLEKEGDSRLRWIILPQSVGPGAARNAGVAAASGDWVAFLDDDDEWLPDRIACQEAAIIALGEAGPDGDDRILLMTQSRVVTPEGEFVRPTEAYDSKWRVDEWLFDRRSWLSGGQSFLQSSSLMAPRSLLMRVPFPPTRLHEDWEIIIRAVCQHGCHIVMASHAPVIHYMHQGKMSLSREGNWRQSLAWADCMGAMLSRRAYAGFCLTVVSQGVTRARLWQAFGPLLWAAYVKGSPTAKQLFAYTLLWAIPDSLRRSMRARLQGERSRLRASDA